MSTKATNSFLLGTSHVRESNDIYIYNVNVVWTNTMLPKRLVLLKSLWGFPSDMWVVDPNSVYLKSQGPQVSFTPMS